MNKYGKKQKKHTRSIFLNTDDAVYVDSERKTFRFSFPSINIEDESKMYVKNTIVDYKTGGALGVKNVVSGLFLGSTATYSATYSQAPAITFESLNGKGTGASAVGLLAPSGISGSATSSTLVVSATAVGAGYTGVVGDYPIILTTNTGGSGATITPSFIDTINGGFSATAVIVAGSGYTEAPTLTVPPPPASVLATFGTVPYTASTGVITGVPTVSNTTTNGFYNTNFFAASFVNNPVQATAFGSTNASGAITNIIINNPSDNGYYGSDAPATIVSLGGAALAGTGLAITPFYTSGRLTSITVTSGGSGYGANQVDVPIGISAPATPVAATITNKTITNGRLQSLTFGTGGSRYYNPSVAITAGLVAPIPAAYAPIFKIASVIAGGRMLTSGKGYTVPPKPIIASTFRIANNGDLPLVAEMAPTNTLEGNIYYTIKADGFQFNRSLYTNSDNKGLPTIAICSTNEVVNNEEYSEIILPAQVINDITLTIHDRTAVGLDVDKNLQILIEIEELDEEHTEFKPSKRQLY